MIFWAHGLPRESALILRI